MYCITRYKWYISSNHVRGEICMKTASVNGRIQENIKEEAEKILSQIGFSSDSH